MVETEREKLGIKTRARSKTVAKDRGKGQRQQPKTETNGGSASGLYVPPDVMRISEVK